MHNSLTSYRMRLELVSDNALAWNRVPFFCSIAPKAIA